MKAFGSLVLILLLVGCGPKIVTVTKTVTEYATLDDRWIVDCVITPPPSIVPYAAADLQHRLDMWAKSYAGFVKETTDCNARLLGARNYNAKKKLETSTVTCIDGICK